MKWPAILVLSCVLFLLVAIGAAMAQGPDRVPHQVYAMSGLPGHADAALAAEKAARVESSRLAPRPFALPNWLWLLAAPYGLVALGMAVALRPSARY